MDGAKEDFQMTGFPVWLPLPHFGKLAVGWHSNQDSNLKPGSTIQSLVFVAAIPCFWDAARAQEDPFGKLNSPQLVLEHADELGLSEEQRRTVEQAAAEAHEAGRQARPGLEKAMESLTEELEKDEIEEGAAREKLNGVLEAERRMKHIHLRMLAKVNNALTAEQKAVLRQLRAAQRRSLDPALEKKLRAKLERADGAIKAKVEAGEHPVEVMELMQRFPELIRQGKYEGAEKLLDEAMGLLGVGDDEGKPRETRDSTSAEPPARPGPFPSAEALKSEIASMRVEDVVWRKIHWKTCLLDGLKTSREQKKPLILWVFIDRPVDDKRC